MSWQGFHAIRMAMLEVKRPYVLLVNDWQLNEDAVMKQLLRLVLNMLPGTEQQYH